MDIAARVDHSRAMTDTPVERRGATAFVTRNLTITVLGVLNADGAAEVALMARQNINADTDVLDVDLTDVTSVTDDAADTLLGLADELLAQAPTQVRVSGVAHPLLAGGAADGRLRIINR
jgi:hypothetical protein